VIVNPVARYVFKTPQKDSHAVAKIFQQMKRMGISRIGVLSSNTGFGKAGNEQIERLAPEHGIQRRGASRTSTSPGASSRRACSSS